MSIFYQNNVNSLKKHCSHAHILSKKTFLLLKTQHSHILFQIFHKKLYAVIHNSGQRSVNSENDTILWAKSIKRMHFFPDFERKKPLFSCPFTVKKRPFSKKHDALMLIFCQKTSILSKLQWSHVIFLIFFMKTPTCHANIWSKKT